jgi:hypothetical protein
MERKRLLEEERPVPTDSEQKTNRSNGEYEITEAMREQVLVMKACGIPHEVIATVIGVSTQYLQDTFPLELAHGLDMAKGKVAGNIFRIAAHSSGRDAVDAGKFWLQANAGWRINNSLEMTGKDGQPIEVNSAVRDLTDEERAIRTLQIINKLTAGGTRPALVDDSGAVAPAPGASDPSVLQRS